MWPTDDRLEKLITHHRGSWLRLAILVAGSRSDGEDLLHDSLIALANAWPRLQTRGVNAYMRRTILNRAIDRSRMRHDTPMSPVPEEIVAADPVLRYEADQAFFDRLTSLPTVQRVALVCRYYLDLSEADTAKLIGCARPTVRSHIHRAVTTLRAAGGEENRRRGPAE